MIEKIFNYLFSIKRVDNNDKRRNLTKNKKNSDIKKINNRIIIAKENSRNVYKKYFNKNYGLNVESRELYSNF